MIKLSDIKARDLLTENCVTGYSKDHAKASTIFGTLRRGVMS